MENIVNFVEKLDKYSLFDLTEIPGLDPKDVIPEMVDLAKLTASGKLLVTRKGNFFKVEGKDPKWVSVYSCAVECSTVSTRQGTVNILLSNLPEGAYITADTAVRVTGLVHSKEFIQKELNRLTAKGIFEKVDKLVNGSVIYRKISKATLKISKAVDKFIEFLKDRGIYEAFEKNFKIQRPQEGKDIRGYLIRTRTRSGSLLSTAFLWINTPEGKDCWCNVDKQYREYLFNLRNDDLKSSQILEAFKKVVSRDRDYDRFLDYLLEECWSID